MVIPIVILNVFTIALFSAKAKLREEGFSERVIDGIWNLTKLPAETYEEYKDRIFSNKDSMLVKLCDLRHNSDLRRLKGITEKDINRMAKYQILFYEIQKKLENLDDTRANK